MPQCDQKKKLNNLAEITTINQLLFHISRPTLSNVAYEKIHIMNSNSSQWLVDNAKIILIHRLNGQHTHMLSYIVTDLINF